MPKKKIDYVWNSELTTQNAPSPNRNDKKNKN